MTRLKAYFIALELGVYFKKFFGPLRSIGRCRISAPLYSLAILLVTFALKYKIPLNAKIETLTWNRPFMPPGDMRVLSSPILGQWISLSLSHSWISFVDSKHNGTVNTAGSRKHESLLSHFTGSKQSSSVLDSWRPLCAHCPNYRAALN